MHLQRKRRRKKTRNTKNLLVKTVLVTVAIMMVVMMIFLTKLQLQITMDKMTYLVVVEGEEETNNFLHQLH